MIEPLLLEPCLNAQGRLTGAAMACEPLTPGEPMLLQGTYCRIEPGSDCASCPGQTPAAMRVLINGVGSCLGICHWAQPIGSKWDSAPDINGIFQFTQRENHPCIYDYDFGWARERHYYDRLCREPRPGLPFFENVVGTVHILRELPGSGPIYYRLQVKRKPIVGVPDDVYVEYAAEIAPQDCMIGIAANMPERLHRTCYTPGTTAWIYSGDESVATVHAWR